MTSKVDFAILASTPVILHIAVVGPLPSEEKKTFRGFKNFHLKVKARIWLDCLICAIFARQRHGRKGLWRPISSPGFWVQGAGIRGQGVELRVQDLGFRVYRPKFS